MAGRKSDFTLTKLDDLFTTQAQRDEEQLSKIRDIPLELIDDFPDHPFKVRDDEDMMQLVESVKERGVITPATVRQKEDGRYELVSGHRRKRACELAGFETLRSEIVDLNRDEATILMVESNFQRSEILPSEKAFAYKMRLEAMKRQAGRPSKENGVPVTKLNVDFQLLKHSREENKTSMITILRFMIVLNQHVISGAMSQAVHLQNRFVEEPTEFTNEDKRVLAEPLLDILKRNLDLILIRHKN